MALKSTVFKAELQIADMDRGHYGTYAITLARHPSENDERLMVRLLAYALHAGPEDERGEDEHLCRDDPDETDLNQREPPGQPLDARKRLDGRRFRDQRQRRGRFVHGRDCIRQHCTLLLSSSWSKK